ncbi:MAG: rplX [Chlamydiia bacterium]|nr:rplX [Chlamydiia bacterium]
MNKNTQCQDERTKKIRKGDKVLVIAGNAKGQTGTVLNFLGQRVVVQGLNMKKKHVKPSERNPKGGILEIEGSIHISNVCVCDKDGAPLKLKIEREANGDAVLYSMKEKERVVYRNLKSPK